MEQIKWIFENMKGSRWKFVLGILSHNFVAIPMMVIAPLFLSTLIDQVFTQGDTSNAYYLLGAYLLVSVLRCGVNYVYAYSLGSAASDVLANIRTTLYDKLQKLSGNFYSRNRTGDIMMRLTGDLETMRHFTEWVMSNAVAAVMIFVAGLVVFFSTNALLASLILIVSPLMAYLVLRMRRLSAPKYVKLREIRSRLNASVQEYIAGNRVVKAFVREDFEKEKFEKLNNGYRDASVEASDVWAKIGPVFNAIGNSILISVFLFGGIMVVYDMMTIGEFFLFYNLNWLINESMRLVGVVINDTQNFFSSTQKVMQLHYARVDIREPENPYMAENEAVSGRIEFDHVSFKYDKSDILRDISISAEPGQTIGIMGPTGSGKTTLAMLMARFSDVSGGSVKVDGVDVREYSLNALRGKIGISMQDVFLFSNTIDANVAYGNPEMEPERVREYAKMADADGFIRKMPDGYDTIVGERGVGLSGGQKQRIALARALAYETPIIILDDTTSAVDMETEKYIQSQLEARQGQHTTFIIAQRISSVKKADKIYIIEDGQISESGTHEELLKNKGYYYDIYCMQQGMNNSAEVE